MTQNQKQTQKTKDELTFVHGTYHAGIADIRAFQSNKNLKDACLKRVENHIRFGRIVKNMRYNGKLASAACAILNEQNHHTVEFYTGIPEWLLILEDKLYNNMNDSDRHFFPSEFLRAIKPGAKLYSTYHLLQAKILQMCLHRDHTDNADVVFAVESIISLHARAGKKEKITDTEWADARSIAAIAASEEMNPADARPAEIAILSTKTNVKMASICATAAVRMLTVMMNNYEPILYATIADYVLEILKNTKAD